MKGSSRIEIYFKNNEVSILPYENQNTNFKFSQLSNIVKVLIFINSDDLIKNIENKVKSSNKVDLIKDKIEYFKNYSSNKGKKLKKKSHQILSSFFN